MDICESVKIKHTKMKRPKKGLRHISWHGLLNRLKEDPQVITMLVMAFLLPFSVEVPLAFGAMLRVPTEPLIALAALLLLADAFRSSAQFRDIFFKKELLWLTPLLLAFLVSIPFSEMVVVSLKFTAVNVLYLFVFFVLMMRLSERQPDLFPRMLLLYGMGLLAVWLWSVYQYWQYGWNPVVMRGIFKPFYNDHTIFGASAALLAAFWLGMARIKHPKKTKIIYFMMGLAFVGLVVFSTSRAAFLSLFFCLFVMMLLKLQLKLLHIAVLLVIAVAAVIVFQQPLVNRLQRMEASSSNHDVSLPERTLSAANISTDVSNLERMNRWLSAWRMFRERPLTGFGPGTYQFTYIPYQDSALMNRLTVTDPHNVPEGSGGTAHNEYLLAMSEMGIMGLLGWLVIIGRWIFVAFSTRKTHPHRMEIVVAFAALATYLFHAMFNNFLTTDKFAFLFWGTAAWMLANHCKQTQSNSFSSHKLTSNP